MSKPKIDVRAIIEQSRINHAELKEGIANANLTKAEKQEIIDEIKDVIALAESLKAENANEKAKRA